MAREADPAGAPVSLSSRAQRAPSRRKAPSPPERGKREGTPPSTIVLQAVAPAIEDGAYPAHRLVGEAVGISVDVLKPGAELLDASFTLRSPGEAEGIEQPLRFVGNDRWEGQFVPRRPGLYHFTLSAWTDRYQTWMTDLAKWIESGEEVSQDLAPGLEILQAVAPHLPDKERTQVESLRGAFERNQLPDALQRAGTDPLRELIRRNQPRPDRVVSSKEYRVNVERSRAGFAAWYEAFPRSLGPGPERPATFREAEERLPEIAAMGFDVLYLPPIHPIGTTGRRGRDNRAPAGPGDPGSPWAIGSSVGGHLSVHPDLGTLEDFDRFRTRAEGLGLEVALDLAFQCSPDHPWVREHPEWFYHRPDGSIRYAENPPKRYRDIYPLDFGNPHWRELWTALEGVVGFWAARGVRIFRVDNPHTKPFPLWEEMIRRAREEYPDLIFLAEAFTRPKVMYHLAKLGFSESYTYFTWRNEPSELREYFQELYGPPVRDFFRPMLFVNTPDILPPLLQRLGRPAFQVRAILAATLSPLWGVYSGYEFLEREGVPGSEEYRDSEKYRVVHRDPSAPGNLRPLLSRLNRIRRENRALQAGAGLGFFSADHPRLLGYHRYSGDGKSHLLVVANVVPEATIESMVNVPLEALGLPEGAAYRVRDLLTDEVYSWTGRRNYVKLDPSVRVAHVLRVEP